VRQKIRNPARPRPVGPEPATAGPEPARTSPREDPLTRLPLYLALALGAALGLPGAPVGAETPNPLAPALRVSDDRPLLAQRALGGIGDREKPEEKEKPEPDPRMPKPDGHRSPLKVGLMSLVVPGAGQFYNGSNSGWLFLGVEAAGWIAWASMRDTGHDIEDRYKRFADAHWSFERYRDPSFEDCPPNGHSDGGVQDSTLVFLFDTRRDDYYEDIGKLDIYFCGWDSPASLAEYRDMRDDSNSFLRSARYALTAVFLNHLVSAIHAARGAAQHNARLPGGAELGLELTPGLVNPGAALTVSRRF
jgi:hypothetical protein